MPRLPLSNHRPLRPQQRGVALFVVIVFVMLSMLLALWASRTSLFNEMVVGNDADYQRAFEAAQALLQDAELDIRREFPDGNPCTAATCRDLVGAADKIPADPSEVTPLLTTLDSQPTKCRSGLCTKRTGRQDFWNYTSATNPPPPDLKPGEVKLEDMTQPTVGARYGQYTGAAQGSATAQANPILQWDATTPNNQGGWYWIELLKYDDREGGPDVIIDPSRADVLALNLSPNVVYRITAVAYGRKPNTMAVLQQTYARQPRKN
ncbi:pilus assembly PilX family protein [Acidovorax sp.]|uniref:pilus assembly PilX family protein n=1 Tax=Acidovorax sp. TaxID=1872122 RepID=UPI002ACE1521|nr:PilX N-terminal domain-containing pilus assembly protein [Acidovorax sp.]MDZ7866655.1 PilX N-terminal domain-containing pilus assembly protein [Acidovorax sp.]